MHDMTVCSLRTQHKVSSDFRSVTIVVQVYQYYVFFMDLDTNKHSYLAKHRCEQTDEIQSGEITSK